MRRAVYSYAIKFEPEQDLLLPNGAEILDVQLQHGFWMLWALIDPNEKMVQLRHIRLVGTGHEFDDASSVVLTHIATVPQVDGNFMWHFFEVGYPLTPAETP